MWSILSSKQTFLTFKPSAKAFTTYLNDNCQINLTIYCRIIKSLWLYSTAGLPAIMQFLQLATGNALCHSLWASLARWLHGHQRETKVTHCKFRARFERNIFEVQPLWITLHTSVHPQSNLKVYSECKALSLVLFSTPYNCLNPGTAWQCFPQQSPSFPLGEILWTVCHFHTGSTKDMKW